MEVVDSRSTLLTNAEVYQMLYGVKEKLKPNADNGKYSTIIYETLKYFIDTPNGPHMIKEPQIIKVIKALKKFNLTSAELMQIINLRPVQPFEVQLIVEESEERLTEEEVEELVKIVGECLGRGM